MADYFARFSAYLPMKSEDAANAALCFLEEAIDASKFHSAGPESAGRFFSSVSDCTAYPQFPHEIRPE